MADSPCLHCANQIGASSNVEPHASLKILNFRRGRRASAPEDLAEFYRCSTCNVILVRDLNKGNAGAKWDWI